MQYRCRKFSPSETLFGEEINSTQVTELGLSYQVTFGQAQNSGHRASARRLYAGTQRCAGHAGTVVGPEAHRAQTGLACATGCQRTAMHLIRACGAPVCCAQARPLSWPAVFWR